MSERDEAQGARSAETETAHEVRQGFEHRATQRIRPRSHLFMASPSMKTAAASLTVLVLAFIALSALTDGFSTWTKEQARRLTIAENKPELPDIEVLDESGAKHSLAAWLKAGHKPTLVEFVYTRCNAVCRTLGGEYQKLQAQIRDARLQDNIGLISISFDPEHDQPKVLAGYAERQHADPALWHFATVAHPAQLSALLGFFGITVIPDEFGGFQHNAALLWVDESGRLTRVADYGSDEQRDWFASLLKTKIIR